MAASVVRSYSKINLGLRIGPPRDDGFHHLTTLYQTLAVHDIVTVEATVAGVTQITMTANDLRVPCDARNTAYRMVSAALTQMGVTARVRMHLEKRLPPQGGMGAGSANAAAALVGLERQLGTAMSGAERLRIAEDVGSDVPLFLIGGTVYGHNRGERVVPYPDLPELPCVIVAPGLGSSTPAAFRAWDERITALTPSAAHGRLDELSRVYAAAFTPAGQERPGSPPGTPSSEAVKGEGAGTLGVSGALDGAVGAPEQAGDLAGNPLLALVRTGIENDFEEVVFQQHPSLREIKRALLEDGSSGRGGALCAMLSGSGSSIFGLFQTDDAARAAVERVGALEMGARAFVTRTIGRKRYWSEMFAR